MTAPRWLRLAGKAMRRPDVAATRVWSIATAWGERLSVEAGGPRFGASALLRATRHGSIEELWRAVAAQPGVGPATTLTPEALDGVRPGAAAMLRARAEAALRHEVDLLGSGPVALGPVLDWHTDFKSGLSWAPRFFDRIAYHDLDHPSDVKVPWELSRLHWLLPAAQAYQLTGEERYAAGIRDVLEQWIAANPYAASINWTCTMEVGLRALSWSWLFHACSGSAAWADEGFRARFLAMLWLHGRFTIRHLEVAPVAGNHYTANAAGLVFAGLFFGGPGEPERWRERGWAILEQEIELQTHPDGVNHEASVPYHRLVLELFHFPARLRARHGLPVAPAYRAHLLRMARFTRACVRPDGLVPVIGDADDARALPMGLQGINDHRYLPPLVGVAWEDPDLARPLGGALDEVAWHEGPLHAAAVAARPAAEIAPAAFPDGGAYVMRAGSHYAYVDCGPVGLRGRGGHGHNDCLACEVTLAGTPLVSDCGAYVYTAAYRERNHFRSTDAHNTPGVDGEEVNRFLDPRNLWNLRDDAQPLPAHWSVTPAHQTFVGGHTGYRRLEDPVTVWRAMRLTATGRVGVVDRLEAAGAHRIRTPLHLAPGVTVGAVDGDRVRLEAGGQEFSLTWQGAGWRCTREPARVSPSYGVVLPTSRLCWSWEGAGPTELAWQLAPGAGAPTDEAMLAELREAVRAAARGAAPAA
ncbi:MAG: alginate lyase family protein [Gemmatimonadetes bacterium]|nr:alginate lyase family protein [Gemmatimonadota bacterium]